MGGRFSGKVVLVTGAASGIGRAAVERFITEGARVVAVDVDEERLGWTDGMADVRPFVGSVADQSVNVDAVAVARSTWGRLDVAFLNAGVSGFGSILEPALDTWNRNLQVNLVGVVHGLRAATSAMVEGGGGAVVVTASTSGIGGDINMWAYNATKAAVINLVRSVAGELAARGVRVNSVCPGPTRTAMAEPIEMETPEFYDAMRRMIPMLRWAEPAEIVNAVAFLASEEASFVTGVTLPVDGGLSGLTRQFEVPEPAS